MNVLEFQKKKLNHEKITMLTCYDYTSARLMANSKVDCLLVGDSAAMTMHGFANTLAASVEMMALHTAAVVRGAPNKFIIGDLPFLSYRQALNENIAAVKILMQAGAQAVKLEGAAGNLDLIKHLVESGVPVMGHLGLTPQAIHALGGFKVQGKTLDAEQQLLQDAQSLEAAGCFAIVLECVPGTLANNITHSLKIPTIGIGAGSGTDGQVLVFQDLLGLNTEFKPKFVKHFINGAEIFISGINTFVDEVKEGVFPQHEHSY